MGEPDFMDEEYFEEMEHLEEIDEETIIVRLGEHIGNLLIEHGYSHIEYVREASDEELLDISGIGRSTLKIIRDTLAAEALLD
nr:hypothetical protein [Candidatus Latescibacterota bacterium]NIO78560.1 hypothetical protein [Candidatus Latescibacterota bacterium]